MLPILTLVSSCGANDAVNFNFTLHLKPRITSTSETFYNDSYFNLDPTEYHEELALASHAMAIAAFPVADFKEDYATQPNNLKDLWKKEGYTDIWCSQNYYEETDVDTIGFAFANKQIELNTGEYCTVITIGIRGADYGAEWASNVTLGDSGDALGFRLAAGSVLDGLVDYVGHRNILGHVKFWTSGFSRAAITANLVAGTLTKCAAENWGVFPEGVLFEQKDIYAYCFEPPMGVVDDYETAHSEKFSNIHNLINFNDAVPLVAPSEWKFTRYGVDHYYPDRLTDIYFDAKCREKAVTRFHYTPNGTDLPDYTIDDWLFVDPGENYAAENGLARATIHPSQGRFLRDLITNLAVNGIGDRESFILFQIQTALQRLFAILNGRDLVISKSDITMDGILKIIFGFNMINVLITELLQSNVTSFVADLEPLFYAIFSGPNISHDDVREFYMQFLTFFGAFCWAFEDRQDTLLQLMNLTNITRIALAHYPELSYAWLSACDSRYYGEDACEFNDGTYYLLRVTESTSIQIFEKNLNRIVFTGQGANMESDIISASYNALGYTDIYLPKNGSYAYYFLGEDAMGTLYNVDPYSNLTVIQSQMKEYGDF